MKKYFVVSFDNEYDLVNATQEFKNSGFTLLDAFTPYAVHGLDKAMGLKPSRLSKICFMCTSATPYIHTSIYMCLITFNISFS